MNQTMNQPNEHSNEPVWNLSKAIDQSAPVEIDKWIGRLRLIDIEQILRDVFDWRDSFGNPLTVTCGIARNRPMLDRRRGELRQAIRLAKVARRIGVEPTAGKRVPETARRY